MEIQTRMGRTSALGSAGLRGPARAARRRIAATAVAALALLPLPGLGAGLTTPGTARAASAIGNNCQGSPIVDGQCTLTLTKAGHYGAIAWLDAGTEVHYTLDGAAGGAGGAGAGGLGAEVSGDFIIPSGLGGGGELMAEVGGTGGAASGSTGGAGGYNGGGAGGNGGNGGGGGGGGGGASGLYLPGPNFYKDGAPVAIAAGGGGGAGGYGPGVHGGDAFGGDASPGQAGTNAPQCAGGPGGAAGSQNTAGGGGGVAVTGGNFLGGAGGGGAGGGGAGAGGCGYGSAAASGAGPAGPGTAVGAGGSGGSGEQCTSLSCIVDMMTGGGGGGGGGYYGGGGGGGGSYEKAGLTTDTIPGGGGGAGSSFIAGSSWDLGGTNVDQGSNPSPNGRVVIQWPAVYNTRTTLVSSGSPSTVGEPVTFTATVSADEGVTVGTVSFAADGTAIAGCTQLSGTSVDPNGGNASLQVICRTAALAVGTHAVVATYSGGNVLDGGAGATFASSASATLTQVVRGPYTINDTDSGISYSGGGWVYSSGRGKGDYQDDVHATTTNGAAFSYTFTGTGISYVTEKSADEGYVDVYIDGIYQGTVDCMSSQYNVPQQTVYSISGLAYGPHTLKVVKDNGTWMLLDALIVQTAGNTINDTDGGIAYSGSGWNHSTGRGKGDYQDDVHATGENGDSFSYTFTGTGISFITEKSADEGNVRVYLDGVYQRTVNCTSSQYNVPQQVLYSISGLAYGPHTLKVVKLDGTWMLLDALTTW